MASATSEVNNSKSTVPLLVPLVVAELLRFDRDAGEYSDREVNAMRELGRLLASRANKTDINATAATQTTNIATATPTGTTTIAVAVVDSVTTKTEEKEARFLRELANHAVEYPMRAKWDKGANMWAWGIVVFEFVPASERDEWMTKMSSFMEDHRITTHAKLMVEYDSNSFVMQPLLQAKNAAASASDNTKPASK